VSTRPRTRYVSTHVVPKALQGPPDAPPCPHCGSEVAWLTLAEFQAHLRLFGRPFIPTQHRPRLGVRHPWWFCHGCLHGGLLAAL